MFWNFTHTCDHFFVDIVTELSYIRVASKVLGWLYFEVFLTFSRYSLFRAYNESAIALAQTKARGTNLGIRESRVGRHRLRDATDVCKA